MTNKKKRTRAIAVGIGAGAAVAAALLTLGLLSMAGLKGQVSTAGGPAWLGAVTKDLDKRGFRWIDIEVADAIATVSGDAPDVDSRRFGFEAAEQAIQAASPDVAVVVDATQLKGADASVGAALKALGPKPAVLDCQTAFQGVLLGRTINFTPGSADLTPDNKRLLDALSAAAIRCRAFAIEVGGHTDASGSAGVNRALSQARAEAVATYLISKGAPRDALTPRGYGSSRLLDRSGGPEADARNRRIEFTVAAR